jgi:glutathione S-transferase
MLHRDKRNIPMAKATLTISSRNYSSWSLRGWLMTRMSGLDFEEQTVPIDDPTNRAELLLLSPSVLVPRPLHDGIEIWDTLAIGEYSMRSGRRLDSSRPIAPPARVAAQSAARCTRDAATCDPRCR